MQRQFILTLWLLAGLAAFAQERHPLLVKVLTMQQKPLAHASVELLKADSSLLKASLTDSAGTVRFFETVQSGYLLHITCVGYRPFFSKLTSSQPTTAVLRSASETLQNLTVSARKPLVEFMPDRTVVNVDAAVTNVGTTVLEVLEKLPGVSVDKDGYISLKGRGGVTIMLDGRPTYLSGAELANLLGGTASAQVSQIELMDTPPAGFDAAGNAGVINIKFKKAIHQGFNGTLTSAYGQGFYPKSVNGLLLNYRTGRVNLYLNYGLTAAEGFTRVYALRTYFRNDGSVRALMEQPSFLTFGGVVHNLRTGVDYSIGKNTSVGLGLSGLAQHYSTAGNNRAIWMAANGRTDSVIQTTNSSYREALNGRASLNFRHRFSPHGELSADADLLHYRFREKPFLQHQSVGWGTYSETLQARIPRDIDILSGRLDYSDRFGPVRLETGLKSSRTNTDNLSVYETRDGNGTWWPDSSKSNHFLYKENIQAAYASLQANPGKWSVQGGLRYEYTAYNARQLYRKDSSFSRNYGGLFPTFYAAYKKDSAHTFSVSAGRRLERPAYQDLNPFVFIINKYTYQRGNPFLRPQYTWNLKAGHVYKGFLVSEINYSVTQDYFSEIFPVDASGIVTYTKGNLSRLRVLGASVSVQVTPLPWWSFAFQTLVNRRKLEGVISRNMVANMTQYELNLTNQFRLKKGWTAEANGIYRSRSQEYIQEILDPSGQLSLGLAKSFAQNKGAVKLTVRDVLYTNWYKGLSYFNGATESFKLTRDTRVATLAFTWRFGKAFKIPKPSEGAAEEEVQRAKNE